MGLPKVRTNNPNGRPKGKKNKVTTEVRTWLKNLIDNNRAQLEKDLQDLEPRDRWNIIERLLAYTVPKMQSVDANIEFSKLTDEHINIIVNDLLKSIENDTIK